MTVREWIRWRLLLVLLILGVAILLIYAMAGCALLLPVLLSPGHHRAASVQHALCDSSAPLEPFIEWRAVHPDSSLSSSIRELVARPEETILGKVYLTSGVGQCFVIALTNRRMVSIARPMPMSVVPIFLLRQSLGL